MDNGSNLKGVPHHPNGVADALAVGIDLGGTSLRVALFDAGMRELRSHRLPTRVADGPEAVISDMARSIADMISIVGPRHHMVGIGIGSPGPLNLELGVLGKLPNFPGWDGFPLRDCLAEATGLPVVLESDANAAALAEWKLGSGRRAQVDSMMMLTLGTGVGSGLILNGEVWQGMFGMGGELGHASIDRNGPVCGCGTRGCLEMYASANGLLRIARHESEKPGSSKALKQLVNGDTFTAYNVASLAESGDNAACQVFIRLGAHLGFAIATVTNTLDLPLIVIGGGVASSWTLFAPSMFSTLRDYSLVYRLAEPTQREIKERNRTFIRPAELGSSAGLLGAGLLPFLASEKISRSVVPTTA